MIAQELFLCHSIKIYASVQFWESTDSAIFSAKQEDECPQHYAINLTTKYFINYLETPHFLVSETLEDSRNVVMLSSSFGIPGAYILIIIWGSLEKCLKILVSPPIQVHWFEIM